MAKVDTIANNGLTIVENYNKLLEQFRKTKTIDDVRILVASVRDFISVYKRVDKNMVNEIYGKLQSKLQDMVAENAFVYDRIDVYKRQGEELFETRNWRRISSPSTPGRFKSKRIKS